jgi:hypothetical protein
VNHRLVLINRLSWVENKASVAVELAVVSTTKRNPQLFLLLAKTRHQMRQRKIRLKWKGSSSSKNSPLILLAHITDDTNGIL